MCVHTTSPIPLSVGLLSDLCPESEVIRKVTKLESMMVANKKLLTCVLNFADQAISTEEGPVWNGPDTLTEVCAHQKVVLCKRKKKKKGVISPSNK